MPQVLFLVSSARELTFVDGSTQATGYCVDEARTAFDRFTEAGVDILVATADGEPPFADPAGSARMPDLPGFHRPVNLAELTDARIAEFDAVLVPGGHGAMVDLADNPDAGRVLRILQEKNAPIVSLSHGAAFLLSAPANSEGQWLFDGYRLTSFTDDEESWTPQGKAGPQWWLETALKGAGAVFDKAPTAGATHVVVDRNLITAQNPASAGAAVEALLTALTDRRGQ
ncbi:type 1 glutamine amidotransferase domain-containing protein [Kibdelosporangium aridum]|uniref:type 1 glutamine amidotransferase domain-containing protein n=1 Tax=Kibdelosporangium aridum TaxID=2030 RepID=UPI0007C59918